MPETPSAGQPVGMFCPGCGRQAAAALGDPATAIQAFCTSDDCHVFMWNPQLSVEQLADDAATTELPDWLT